MPETASLLPEPPELAWVHGEPTLAATIKQEFGDFQVDEELGFALAGQGDHLWLRIAKRDLSTTDVARRLASVIGARLQDVGYSGMKDRRAECRQWFSLPLTRDCERRLPALEDESLAVLETGLNHRKLRIGVHRANRFRLLLRELRGPRSEFAERLARLPVSGLPNYFGAQRFGRNMSNIHQVLELMQSADGAPSGRRRRRGMLYSAARACLFNQILSERVRRMNWDRYIDGDVLNLDGASRYFVPEGGQWSADLEQRLRRFDIHISGCLAGVESEQGRYTSRGEAADIEKAVLQRFQALRDGLVRCGVKAGRRPLRFRVGELDWSFTEAGELSLGFVLPRGAYATSLLRELCKTRTAKGMKH